MPWLRLRADQRASHCRRAKRARPARAAGWRRCPPVRPAPPATRRSGKPGRNESWYRLEEEIDGQHPAQVGMPFHGPTGIGQRQRGTDRNGSLAGGQLEAIGRTVALRIAIILDLHGTTQCSVRPVLQANVQRLISAQVARLAILPRGAEPRGETLQVAIFGRWDLPQLDAQQRRCPLCPSAARRRMPCVLPGPQAPPRYSEIRCAGRRTAERPPNRGKPPTREHLPAPATRLRKTRYWWFGNNSVDA